MQKYISDVYGNNQSSLGGLQGHNQQAQPARPGQQPQPQNKYPQQLPSNNIQRMNAAHLARQRMMKSRAGPGQRQGRAGRRQVNLGQWNSKCKISNVSLPQLIASPSCSQRYRVTFTWIDAEGRPHRKDINFGEQGKQQFIDHRNPSLRDARLAKMQEQTLMNPLHPNFWQFHMLNQYPDLNVAYLKFVQEHDLTNQKVVLKKQFRRNYNPLQSNAQTGSRNSGSRTQNIRLPNSVANMLPSNNDLLSLQELDNEYQFKY